MGFESCSVGSCFVSRFNGEPGNVNTGVEEGTGKLEFVR